MLWILVPALGNLHELYILQVMNWQEEILHRIQFEGHFEGLSLTPLANVALDFSHKSATKHSNPLIEPAHLLYGLVRIEQGAHWLVWTRLELDCQLFAEKLTRHFEGLASPQLPASAIRAGAALGEVLKRSAAIAKTRGYSYVGTEHFLLAILEQENPFAAYLHQSGIDTATTDGAMREVNPKYYKPNNQEA